MNKLLICGSRNYTGEMERYCYNVIVRVEQLGWSVIVGDASGVDSIIISYCQDFNIPYTCYGITDKPRCWYASRDHYVKVQGNFLARDRVMVDAADRVLAVWNGESRGTKYTYDYAVKRGKTADLMRFGGAIT